LVVLLRYAHDQYLESNIYGADEVVETNVAAVSETIGEAVVGTTEATVSETAENKVE